MPNITIFVGGDRCVVPVKLDATTINILPRLEGRKKWIDRGLEIESSWHNLRLFKDRLNATIVDDRRKEEPRAKKATEGAYTPAMPRLPHQEVAFNQFLALNHSANFGEPGTGKSKVFIDLAGLRYATGLVTGIMLYSPKNVHRQWIEEQIPTHLDPRVKWNGVVWRPGSKAVMEAIGDRYSNMLDVVSFNIDAADTKSGREAAQSFIRKHPKGLYIAIDESQGIMNYKALRTKALMEIRHHARFRHIMSGTPSPSGLENLWSQFQWLDDSVLGIKYVTSFRREYCIMGGYLNREVVGYRDIEKFNRLTGPYIHTVSQQDIGRAPALETTWRFSMTPEQREVYDALRKELVVEIDQLAGEWKVIVNKDGDDPRKGFMAIKAPLIGVKLLRLQQITSGFMIDEKKEIHEFKTNPRLDELEAIIENKPKEKLVIWCRFRYDIDAIIKRLGGKAVEYHGGVSEGDREAAKKVWLDPRSGRDYLVATGQTGGVGLNLQGPCHINISYSHSYNAVVRWQMLKRIDRIGATGLIENIDMICKASTDPGIISNLRAKKNIQDLGIKGVRELLEGFNDKGQG